jgi:hypothetical protein
MPRVPWHALQQQQGRQQPRLGHWVIPSWVLLQSMVWWVTKRRSQAWQGLVGQRQRI